MSKVTLGLEGKAYLLSSGTRATWNATVTNGVHVGAAPSPLAEINLIRNAQLNLTSSEANVSSRKSDWELIRRSLKKADIDLELPWDSADTNLNLLLQAFMTGGSVAVALLDGDKSTTGSQGLWADFTVTESSREENLDKEMIGKFKLKPTYSGVFPEWVQVA